MIRKKKDLGIYIHIPFCARKCAYCDFVSAPASRGEIEYYADALCREIRAYRSLGNHYQVSTIFVGGGTPSLIAPDLLRKVMDQLKNQFLLTRDAEITVECNPGTLTEEKLRTYRDMGVNRLSMGVQSADNGELALLGRIHTWEEFLENYHLARQLGFDNINLDLMSALPGQTTESWLETLRRAADLEPEHISAYSLIIEEGTLFYDRYSTKEGRALLPDEEIEREMYRITEEYLALRGYHRYEISNYAKPGRECRHNKTYWTGGEYLGFGMAACSYLAGRRFGNPSDYLGYWEHAEHPTTLLEQAEELSVREQEEEFMFLGLRMMDGVSKRDFFERFATDFASVYGETAERFIKEGLLAQSEDGDRIFLTARGIDVSNQVMAEFLQG